MPVLRMTPFPRSWFAACLVFAAVCCCGVAELNLVSNGSFELIQPSSGGLVDWACAGSAGVKQRLIVDRGQDGNRYAKLECTAFDGDGPDFHAMICQVGKVSVRQGQWYRLAFWAKAQGIRRGSVDVGLSDTRRWENAGLSGVFAPGRQWGRFEFRFCAREDLPPEASRLQFWFKSTGTLWLDDVTLLETEDRPQWFPKMSTDGVKNFVPNSSFECGTANWGGFTYGLIGWAGNLYRLEGVLDATEAWHGSHSLKISLSPSTEPVFHFDYYEPIRQPIQRVLVANRGWFRVEPGQKLTLSAWLKGDADDVVAQLVAVEAPDRVLQREVTVSREWRRHTFIFTTDADFLFIAVGLDLEASHRQTGTLWVDGVQLERGDVATDYKPRRPVESFIETVAPGNTFTNPVAGMAVKVRAFNNTDREQRLAGNFCLTDFFDSTVSNQVSFLIVPPHGQATLALDTLCKDRTGFFRATWTTQGAVQSLRCAIIDPLPPSAIDSPFGFNHAYPWDYLVRAARQAGILWWRDWSAKWQTVEPEQGKWDFSAADAQIRRVLSLDCQVEVLLPFPSALWSTSAQIDEVERVAGRDGYLRSRLPLSYAPKNLKDFGIYAAQVARHYAATPPRGVTHIQVLNEPLYTDYALYRGFGYSLPDYLRLLSVAGRALRQADPNVRIVGGISANLEAGLTRDFVTAGGLRLVDVFDLHMYDPPRPAESYEEPLTDLEKLMAENGGPKPVWITEWGCYADDDPACVPETVGDETMNRCRWPGERQATEHIVKFAAVSFAHDVRKIFFHAGTCAAINAPDAGGVLFEFGGTPRKMYPGISAFTKLLGVPDQFIRSVFQDGIVSYLFRCHDRFVAVAWCEPGAERPLRPLPIVQAFDIMGNRQTADRITITPCPVYLVADTPEPILRTLEPKP